MNISLTINYQPLTDLDTTTTHPQSAQVIFKSNNLKIKKEAPNTAQMFIEFEQYHESVHYQQYSWRYLYLFVSLSTRRQLIECLRQ